MAQMSGAPGFVTLGPNQYRMSPLGNDDLDEFMNWVRAEHVAEARRAAKASAIPLDGLEDEALKDAIAQNKEEEARMVDRAFDQAGGSTLGAGISLARMTTPKGVARLLGIGIRKNHPDVTDGEILKEIMTPEVMEASLAEYDELNDDGKKNDVPDFGAIRQARRQRKAKQKERKRHAKVR